METHDRLIQALTDRSVYEHPTTEIVMVQTHLVVVLTGPYAYKIKSLSIWALSISRRLPNGTSSARKNSASIAVWLPNCTWR